MCYINKKQIVMLAFFLGLLFPVFAQQNQMYNDVKPFSGAKEFRKWSIGINAGVLNPSIIFGGSNDFAKPQYTLGYGANYTLPDQPLSRHPGRFPDGEIERQPG